MTLKDYRVCGWRLKAQSSFQNRARNHSHKMHCNKKLKVQVSSEQRGGSEHEKGSEKHRAQEKEDRGRNRGKGRNREKERTWRKECTGVRAG